MVTDVPSELRMPHEVMVAEISRAYKFHSTWDERKTQAEEKRGREVPFKMFIFLDDQSTCQRALTVLCSVFEQMIIPQECLSWVITELCRLLELDIYNNQLEYKAGLDEILRPTVEKLTERLAPKS